MMQGAMCHILKGSARKQRNFKGVGDSFGSGNPDTQPGVGAGPPAYGNRFERGKFPACLLQRIADKWIEQCGVGSVRSTLYPGKLLVSFRYGHRTDICGSFDMEDQGIGLHTLRFGLIIAGE
jgi:hypothetical protein